MLAGAHRSAAEDIEAAIAALASTPRAARLIIEGAWGAAIHWLAFGCQTKHGQHQDSHARLGTFLRAQGATTTADNWERLDQLRQGSWYGSRIDPQAQQAAVDVLREIRAWATS
ncbi:MAG TPA: hypothetical protein VGR57_20090 [Ktedonobacterales bacterium]|nr:hypothetical protein [Ktedonobacterales bacterium]